MKKKNFLTLMVFVLAIGSSLASSYLVPIDGYTRKADVPGQVANCVLRDQCDGTSRTCTATFDHDNNSATANITRDLYSPASTCVSLLSED